jgi:hypothetical protein
MFVCVSVPVKFKFDTDKFVIFVFDCVEFDTNTLSDTILPADIFVDILLVNVNNGVIPVDFNKNDTLKSIVSKTIRFLNEMTIFNSKQMVMDGLNKIK